MANFNYEKLFNNIRTNIGILKTQAQKLNGLLVDAQKTKNQKLIASVEKGYNKTAKALKKAEEMLASKQTSYNKTKMKLAPSHKVSGDSTIPKPILSKYKPVKPPMDNNQLFAIASAAVAFTAIVASAVLYKKYFSAAAKFCKGLKGLRKENCMTKHKIAGYEASVKSLQKSIPDCAQTKDPFKCKYKMQDKIVSYSAKIRKYKKRLNEIKSISFVNDYLEYLHEDRGPNFPIEGDNKPNYIRTCMMQEDDRVKIRCLRRLKEITAMNPFYQYRIDRFIDAITNTYEPTTEPGFNEFKEER